MLTETPSLETSDEVGASADEGEPSGSEGDPPDPVPLAASVIPCTVWFGPTVHRTAERELLAMLGSHNGVAVLQWPRDADRARRCWDLGIPTLVFVHDRAQLPPRRQGLVEWLPSSANDGQVHDSLTRLSQYGATQRRAAATPILDHGCLHLGRCEVHLDPSASDLAAVLVANFDQAVDDTVLSSASGDRSTAHRSLFGELLHLDREVNQIGLEVVPVNDHEHAIRRCGR
jgi:hypothetical protein